jgi:hypothetical protein
MIAITFEKRQMCRVKILKEQRVGISGKELQVQVLSFLPGAESLPHS